MAEAVRVIVRCRPMNAREKGLNCKEVISMDNNIGQCTIRNPGDEKAVPKSFTFDGAYFVDSTTEQIYADVGFALVEGVTEGYNGTVFAYGQTGCGKSFSMQGIVDPATQRGIIPRAFDHIFETIRVTENVKYLVHASYLEIYNEDVRDLLGKDAKAKLDLKEHPEKGVYVQDLSLHPVKNVSECEAIMAKGWNNRATGATLMNADSSRSHSIFTIRLERCDRDPSGEDKIRAGKLNLVDLAGSERQGKTGATGDRLKEATKINLSLSALGNVISALVDGKSKHIPYRDSKLTRLLQDSLGGNTKTLMVACLSPADNNYDETLSTLRYANRAKNIKNKPKINEDPKDAMLREYQDEISKLKAMLRGEIPVDLGDEAGLTPKSSAPKVVEKVIKVTDEEALAAEKEKLKQDYDEAMLKMKEEFNAMKIDNRRMEEEMERLRFNYDENLASVDANAGQAAEQNGIDHDKQEDEEYIDGEDEEAPQRAVHLGTMRTREMTSPTLTQQEQMRRRLQELQQTMVGGEESKNAELQEQRRVKKRHADEHRNKLEEAIAKLDGEDIMLGIYDDVQEELKATRCALDVEKKKIFSLEQDLLDQRSEFEYDRADYLDTIRRGEKSAKLLQSIIDRIVPCLRRDCNYVNLDKIKAQCTWDEEGQEWTLPKLTIEKTKLPMAGLGQSSKPDIRASTMGAYQAEGVNGDAEPEDFASEERYLQKLHRSAEQELANSYFKNSRQEKLLNKGPAEINRAYAPSPQPPTYDGFALESTPSAEQLRAAHVHGQNGSTDDVMRKPQRLEALAPLGSGSGGKKKRRSKINATDFS